VFDGAVATFKPQAVVMCCGADTLGADPLGKFNLSPSGIAAAVRHASGLLIKGLPISMHGPFT